MVSRAVTFGAEVKIIRIGRDGDRPQRVQTGVGYRRGWKTRIHIGVIWRVDLQIDQAQGCRPPALIDGAIAQCILNRWIGIQFHIDLKSIQIDRGNERLFLIMDGLPLYHRGECDRLVNSESLFLKLILQIGGEMQSEVAQETVDKLISVNTARDNVGVGEEKSFRCGRTGKKIIIGMRSPRGGEEILRGEG